MTPTNVPDHRTAEEATTAPLPWYAHMKTRLAVVFPLAALVVGLLVVLEREARADLTFKELRNSAVVACGTSATEIAPSAGSAFPQSMQIQNTSATAVYVGGSGVTTGTGIELCDGCAANQLWQGNVQKAYCIVASGSVNVQVAWATR